MLSDGRQASTLGGFLFLRLCVWERARDRESGREKMDSLGQFDVTLWGNNMFSQAEHAFYYIMTFICKYSISGTFSNIISLT